MVSETAYYWRTTPLTLQQLTLSEFLRWRSDISDILRQKAEAQQLASKAR